VIQVIAEALRVELDYFLEYRLRQVACVLEKTPVLADKLYGILLHGLPVPDDLADALKRPRNGGNGGSAGPGFSALGF
jgi:hypothetical protein